MINPRTGHLLFAPSQCVRAGDSVEAVLALGLGETNDVNDVHTGWSWLRVPNVRVGNDSLSLVFGFHHNRLQMVALVKSLVQRLNDGLEISVCMAMNNASTANEWAFI